MDEFAKQEPTYFGHKASYWLELEKRVKSLDDGVTVSELIGELATLKGQLSFIKSRMEQIKEII